MSTGTGIAVAGIWLAIAMIGVFGDPGAAVVLGLFAMIPTLAACA